jgi:dipeptidyl aminopeptidase/acylaminoacyl peptidase
MLYPPSRRPLAARLALASLALLPLVAPFRAAVAQETPSDTLLTVDHYLDYETVADPQISPDGRQIVYTRRWVNRVEDKWESALWIVGADGSRNRFLAKGSNAVWSPDGTRIAYLNEGEPKGAQIFVRYMDAEGGTTQITRVSEAPQDIHWSPDGKSIGFVMFVAKPNDWKIDLPKPPKDAKWTGAPRLVERLHYRQDRRGFTEPGNTHLFVVSADGGSPRQITSGDWSVGARFDELTGPVGWDWTPDGRSVVVDGMNDAKADLNYRNSNIYLIDVATSAARRLTPADGVWESPAVSPDGKRVAFVGYPATTQTYRAADLYVVGIDGAGMKKISGTLDRDPERLTWARDGSGVYFAADDRGTSNVYFAQAGGGVRAVTTGAHVLTLGSVSRGGVAAGVRSTFRAPTDVVRIDLKKPGTVAQLTHVNDDLLERIKLGDVEEVTYASSGGAKVQGWIVKPPGFDKSKKYPLILEIHGGPHGMYNVGFNYMFQNFAADGYVVLYTNPRGSTGYGTDFGNAINRRYPGVDYDDLMAGVDTLVGRGYVDESSMFVGGCSGGGVLSSWVIGHTTRFAAAAVRCPVTDWVSMAGQTDVPLFTYNFFDAPFWEKPEQWLKQSPLMYVGHVTTPTLIMTGELDMRTPMPQSDEYYAALKMRGVPTALLRFEGEYHGTGSKPSNFMRTQLYMMSWYKRYGGKKPTTAATGSGQ